MSSTTARPSVAAEIDQWLTRFDQALTSGDPAGAAELFAPESYWRDLVAFTWNIKTVEGRPGVKDMLEHTLGGTRPRGWRVTEEPAHALHHSSAVSLRQPLRSRRERPGRRRGGRRARRRGS